VATGTKEVDSSTAHVWAAGFHHVAALSRLSRVLKLMNVQFCNFPFSSDCDKPRILNQWIRGHDYIPCEKIQACNFILNRQKALYALIL
jgi:hypothetical protein